MIRKLLAFLVIAAAANFATVLALPRIINAVVLHKAAQLGGENVALPAPRVTAESRGVVRPSPDLLYTACVFDLSKGPLHISAPVQDSYVSVAAFAADTSNFFSQNDSQVAAGADGVKRFDIVLARDSGVAVPARATLVVAPSTRGLVLFRSLVQREEDFTRLRQDYQLKQECRPL